ncbi:peptidase domain-containing ABC transporter [Micromonospora sp. NPDC051296]|uniref:peptidase domain-containing ABC transporter n=1 Tax=Micromonospora sp. NPDC051296 TaxID=3155046 RepID=UPI00343638E7
MSAAIRSWWRRRVPVRLQLTTVECGAACLAMVLSHHGRRTSVSHTRQRCAPGRGGVSALAIAQAARSYGMRVRGLRGEPTAMPHVALPAIAHWERDHFVVVERWNSRYVDIVDPAWGRRRVTKQQFDEGLSDAVLELRPGPDFDTSGDEGPSSAKILVRMITRLPGIRFLLLQVLLVTVALQVFGLALPVTTKFIVDEVFGLSRDDLVALLGLALLVIIAAQVIAAYLRALLLIYLQGRIDWQLLVGFAGHLYRLPLRFFHQRTTGDLATRINGIAALRDLIANQTLTATLDAMLVLTYFVLMFAFDPVLASVVAAVLVIQVVIVASTHGRARDLLARSIAAQTGVNEYVIQTISGISTVKAVGAERRVVDELTDRIVDWSATTLRRNHLGAGLDTATGMLRMLTPLLVLWLGAWRVLDGQLSIGTLLGFTWLAAAVLAPMSTLLANWQRLQVAAVQLERIGDVLKAAPERGGDQDPRPGPEGSRLELRDVTFHYDEGSPPAVSDVTLAVEPGQRVAIVGRSGAGKTTLAMLMLGLYQPTSGEIRCDGVPLPDIAPVALRRRFGVVLQEPFTMRASIRDNIAFGLPEATLDDVVWAARIAEVDPEVNQLPLGYDTPLAERGVGLSGGQLQRLAIARALVRRPSILVFDEATSHLDAETEQRIVANLREVTCTQVVIAHRLSTIQNADVIVVLHEGQVIEAGSHADLVESGGPYAALVAAQTGAGGDPELLAELLAFYEIEPG